MTINILYVAPQTITAEMMNGRYAPLGYSIQPCSSVQEALGIASPGSHDFVVVDPAMSDDVRGAVLDFKKALNNVPYVVLLGDQASPQDVLSVGANTRMLASPSAEHLDHLIDDAERLRNLINQLADESEDFPSAGGVIAKTAFNQLFLSSLQLAARNEKSNYLIFIEVDNYSQIVELDGPHGADYAVSGISKFFASYRRQSDVMGQIGKAQFALLLQGMEEVQQCQIAMRRLIEGVQNNYQMLVTGAVPITLSLRLMAIPKGNIIVQQKIAPPPVLS